jgi:hypothetical protein
MEIAAMVERREVIAAMEIAVAEGREAADLEAAVVVRAKVGLAVMWGCSVAAVGEAKEPV